MIVMGDTVLGDTWRLGVTFLALGFIGGFWYLICSNLTPFPNPRPEGIDAEADATAEDAPNRPKYPKLRPSRYPKIQRFSVTADIVLFVWIVVEGMVVIPFFLIRYGLH